VADTDAGQGRQKIGRQIVLPFSKAFEIAWGGIRIRLWRSLITMSGIILAIAFLMSVWTAGVFDDALRNVPETHELYPLVQGALEAEAIAGGGVRIRCVVVEEHRATGDITPGTAIRNALDADEAFSGELVPAAPEVVTGLLAGDAPPGVVVLSGLPEAAGDPEVLAELTRFVQGGGLLIVYGAGSPGAASTLGDLLPATLQGGTFGASDQIERDPQGLQVNWRTHPAAGFAQTTGKPDASPQASADGQTLAWLQARRGGWVAWYPVSAESAEDPDVISWFARGQTTTGGAVDASSGSLLVRLIARGAGEQEAKRDMRGVWLVTLSLMVCVVGITNAMLMSVTERFREIGTMKCLGALDKFVVKLFLIESSLQGVAGSLAGAVIGFALAFVRALFTFHVEDLETGESYWLSLRFFPVLTALLWFAIALTVGVVLSVVAAIYPAIRAARMEPVQAMRTEA
jgi:ABC-type antimicrobial peptide transport system permease subunit